MTHIVSGLFLIAFGLWRVFDSWHFFLDDLRGGVSVFFLVIGILSISLAIVGPEKIGINLDSEI